MPEQITKYPNTTMDVLESAGAQCAEGVEPRILTQCPSEQFCSLPGGEICVYGIDQIPQITQITQAELGHVICPENEGNQDGALLPLGDTLAFGGVFVLGLVAGKRWQRRRDSGPE